ncbi:MAG: hypothetical protein KGZ35_07555 [Truepera sp.]|nr:hypothetical protein [Truepera sp.]
MPSKPITLALDLLHQGQEEEARRVLSGFEPGYLEEEAESLALQGFVAARRGDRDTYRTLTLEAARQAQTSLTLYHLGLALPPRKGLTALQEALHLFGGRPEATARLHLALAVTLERLGRQEALAHAALARLQAPSPWTLLHHLRLELLFGRMVLEEVEQTAVRLLPHPTRGVRLLAGHTLVLCHLLQGEQAQAGEVLLALLPSCGPGSFASFLVEGVMALKGRPEMHLLLESAAAWAKDSEDHGLLCLAEGLYLFPQAAAEPLLEEAALLLADQDELQALRAQAHLAALLGQPLAEPYQTLAEELRREARPLFVPSGLLVSRPYLQVLGEGRWKSFHALRLRGLELLVLLLARPQGWPGTALAQALYGEANLPALRVELHRLRAAGLEVRARPYRLLTPLEADFLELREALESGNLHRAVELYQGPLLPRSQAPGVEALRFELEEALRSGVLQARDPGLLYGLAQRLEDDLELWEATLETLSPHDARYPATLARVRRLRAEYLD